MSDAVNGGDASGYVRFVSKADANSRHRRVSRSAISGLVYAPEQTTSSFDHLIGEHE
jgi:hypothetical protein